MNKALIIVTMTMAIVIMIKEKKMGKKTRYHQFQTKITFEHTYLTNNIGFLSYILQFLFCFFSGQTGIQRTQSAFCLPTKFFPMFDGVIKVCDLSVHLL